MMAAIEARRVQQEARAAAIERGELEVEDPRDRRLREQKEAAAKEKAAARAAKAEVKAEGGAKRRSRSHGLAPQEAGSASGSPTLVSRLSRRLGKAGSSFSRTVSSLAPSSAGKAPSTPASP